MGFMLYRMLYAIILVLFFAGCSTKSPDYFQSRGRGITTQLLERLQDVHDLDDLIEALPRLQRLFDELVDVMIETRKWQIKEGVIWDQNDEDTQLSHDLCDEFNRLFSIPAARDLIEKSQQQALERLDAFEKKSKKEMLIKNKAKSI